VSSHKRYRTEIAFTYFREAMKDKNPVDHVRFFRKGNHTQAFTIPKEDVSLLIPLHFSENYIRIYARDPKKVVICIVFGIIYPRERLINLCQALSLTTSFVPLFVANQSKVNAIKTAFKNYLKKEGPTSLSSSSQTEQTHLNCNDRQSATPHSE
jgi:hypothetical protein